MKALVYNGVVRGIYESSFQAPDDFIFVQIKENENVEAGWLWDGLEFKPDYKKIQKLQKEKLKEALEASRAPRKTVRAAGAEYAINGELALLYAFATNLPAAERNAARYPLTTDDGDVQEFTYQQLQRLAGKAFRKIISINSAILATKNQVKSLPEEQLISYVAATNVDGAADAYDTDSL
jgi:hypothetical protein